MIEWVKSKKVPTKAKKNYDGFITQVMALRVCDKCGSRDETRWTIVKNSRERRNSDKDYCYKCSQLGRPMPKGNKDPKWKHGLTYNGYVRICVNQKRMLQHVHVMQEFLGRELQKGETVHHIDMDKTNNVIDNLYLFESQAAHQTCHLTMEKCGFELLGNRIWFDWDKKEYVLWNIAQKCVCDIEVPQVGKLHIDQGYWVYNLKLPSGKWIKKRYHNLIAETILGRPLYAKEVVHHVDGNKLNNPQSNLCVVTRIEHGRAHCTLQKCVAELYKIRVVNFENGKYSLT